MQLCVNSRPRSRQQIFGVNTLFIFLVKEINDNAAGARQ